MGAGSVSCLTWLGHSGFLGSLAGHRFLIDPLLSRRVGLLYPRHGSPPIGPRQLPGTELALVTHNHYDHLDAITWKRLPRTVTVVVPRGLGHWFRRRGFRSVVELEWWSSAAVGGLEVTLVPARHWSRRGIFDTNRSLWGGFVVRAAGRKGAFYHAGDSALFDGFEAIGRAFPDLEVAMLPIGGYRPAWFMEHNHMNPEQAGRAFLALGARRLVPMHWGAFQLTDEPLREPVERLKRWWRREGPADGRSLRVLAVGETLLLDEDNGLRGCAPHPTPIA